MSFKAFFLSLTVTTMLLYSIVGTTTVYADDGTGTEPTATEPAPPVDEEQPTDTGTEVIPPVEVVPEVVPPVEEVTVEEVLDQLPENTTVTVLDSEGEALPLASQETADAIESAYDPIWCPAGQVPTPGANGCTRSYSSFDELLTFLEDNEGDVAYQTAGTIYIQQGAYLGGETEIDFNNYTFTNFNQHDLTLQGGWDTTWDPTDPSTPFPEYTTTTFNAPIIIGSSSNPWVGSLTINNIGISGVTSQTGLTVYSDGNVTLSEVEVTNSLAGANLNAGGYADVSDSKFNNNANGGATIQAGGDTYVNNSEFNNNGSTKTDGYGVKINSGGEVDVFATNASFNEIFGADITAAGPVFIDRSTFSGNVSYSYSCKGKVATGGYGLKVVSQGDIYLDIGAVEGDAIQANDNYEFGAYLEGAYVNVAYSTFNNNGYGLKVVSKDLGGTVGGGYSTLYIVTANNNKLFGADVTADHIATVRDSFFDGNKSYTYSCKGTTYQGYGLKVVAQDIVGVYNTSASGNNLFGANLTTLNSLLGGVTVDGGTFSNNGSAAGNTGKGLEVSATSALLANVKAENNQLFGANIDSKTYVTIINSVFSGNKSYTYSCKGQKASGGYGLKVVSTGDIALTNVSTTKNYEFGASLSGADVAILDGFFNENGSGSLDNPTGKGLEIVSTGNVALLQVQAMNNQLFGANIKAEGHVSIAGTLATHSIFSGNKAYTYSCKGKTYQGYGLNVVSTNGDIAMINVNADGNYLYGAHLEGVNIEVSVSTFSNNGTGNQADHIGKGLEVVSTAEGTEAIPVTVSLYKVTANNNQLFGTDITAKGDVKIENSIFSGNISYSTSTGKCSSSKTYDGYGLKVVTTKDIELDTVTANDNGTFGASLNGVDVQVTNSIFNNNKTSNGLTITAATATLNNVTALNNGGNGAKICATISAGVDASNFQDNGLYGLNVGSPVFNEGVNTYLNNGSGSVFYNTSCATTSTGNGSGHGWHGWGWGWNWNHHKPKIGFGHGHGASYFGGSCNKSQHAYAKKW